MDAGSEIWRTVKTVMDEHGEEALVHAASMADRMFDDGDLTSWAMWMNVVEAIEEFQCAAPTGPLH